MKQLAIPYVFMRGGTSRGPYFRRDDLPTDLDALAKVLTTIIGSGHPFNINGIGGGTAVTTKVAMLSKSDDEWADIDYFFAQVAVEEEQVDYKPTCGNILSGVGAAAIELGLFTPTSEDSEIKIRAVNTGAQIVAKFKTPNNRVNYDGNQAIAGVPGTGAPISLNFMGTVGAATGAMLATGNTCDEIDGIQVTCIDVAMPVVIARAEDFGLSGYESAEELDNNREFFERMEAIRRKAGELMGMGDVSQSVTPKFAIVARPQHGGTVATRYFMPKKTHPSMAVTGAQAIAACTLLPGSVAEGVATRPAGTPPTITLEHASGTIDVIIDYTAAPSFMINSAGLVRTARKIADGYVYVDANLDWREDNNHAT